MAAFALAFAYVLAKPAVPDFRSVEQMNADEAERSQARKTKAWIDSQWDVKP
jgi:hypothetical protein